jgi:UDP-glucose 4-epimerase
MDRESEAMGNFLVTGAAGYIGSTVAKMLIEKCHSVIGIDNLSTGDIKFVPSGLDFVLGDVSNLELMLSLGEKVDGVIHLAGIKFAGESFRNPEKFYRDNTLGSLNAGLAALRSQQKILVFSSSCSVYGNDNQNAVTEKFPLNPISPYGRSKLMSETILQDLSLAHGLNLVSLRYFNVIGGSTFGAFDKSEFNLFPNLCRALRDGSKMKIFGSNLPTTDGTCIRDYVDLYDIAQAHLLVVEKMMNSVELKKHYNLGSAQGLSVLEVIKTFEEVSNTQISVDFCDHRPGDPFAITCSFDLAKADFNWEPTVSILESVTSQLSAFSRGE